MSSKNQTSDFAQPEDGPIGHLRGRTILVTRAAEQASSLCERLEGLGANVVVHPAIEIKPPADLTKLDSALKNLNRADSNDWLVFVSGNGVSHFFDRLGQLDMSIDVLNKRNVVAIGSATLAQLEALGIKSANSPEVANSESLADLISARASGQRVLIVRADRGSDELANRLKASGIEFEEVVAYRSTDVKSADPQVLKMISAGKIDWVTMTSSAIACSSIRLFGSAINASSGIVKTVSISPKTSQAMRELGFEPTAEATEYNMSGIIAAMQNSE